MPTRCLPGMWPPPLYLECHDMACKAALGGAPCCGRLLEASFAAEDRRGVRRVAALCSSQQTVPRAPRVHVPGEHQTPHTRPLCRLCAYDCVYGCISTTVSTSLCLRLCVYDCVYDCIFTTVSTTESLWMYIFSSACTPLGYSAEMESLFHCFLGICSTWLLSARCTDSGGRCGVQCSSGLCLLSANRHTRHC